MLASLAPQIYLTSRKRQNVSIPGHSSLPDSQGTNGTRENRYHEKTPLPIIGQQSSSNLLILIFLGLERLLLRYLFSPFIKAMPHFICYSKIAKVSPVRKKRVCKFVRSGFDDECHFFAYYLKNNLLCMV